MSMYHVGDVVKIREDLMPDMIYPTEDTQASELRFVNEMLPFLGCECVITKVTLDFDRVLYKIQEDHGDSWWCSSMFEGLADTSTGVSCDIDCLIGGG